MTTAAEDHLYDLSGLHVTLRGIDVSRCPTCGRVMAAIMGTDFITIVKWENGVVEVPGPVDRLVRLLSAEADSAHRPTSDDLRKIGCPHAAGDRRRFHVGINGWQKVA